MYHAFIDRMIAESSTVSPDMYAIFYWRRPARVSSDAAATISLPGTVNWFTVQPFWFWQKRQVFDEPPDCLTRTSKPTGGGIQVTVIQIALVDTTSGGPN
jgi:hypothetical protein